jgi:cysteinyl-tRNA synthetase
MSYQYLGEQIDIHGGGSDLVFPHHENEIAQTESFTGQPFARYWMHNGMLQFTGEKMSKSIGNVISVEAFLEDHEAEVLRLIILNGSYRSPLVFNEEVIAQAEASLERLRSALAPADPEAAGDSEAEAKLQAQIKETRDKFKLSMDDDFNTPGALSGIFDLVRTINAARDAGADPVALSQGQEVLLELAKVLGLRLHGSRAEAQPAAPFIEILLQVRQQLRQAKQFELADSIRDMLAAQGVEIEDRKGGATWRQARD